MAIVKWHPYGIRPLQDFDDLFNRFFTNKRLAVRSSARKTEPAAWSIPLDVVQSSDELVVTASVPGTAVEDIDVSVDDNVLTIRAEAKNSLAREAPDDSESSDDSKISDSFLLRERRTGTYFRALRLPETVDFDRAETTFKDGVLTIRLPKLESKKVRKLEISAA